MAIADKYLYDDIGVILGNGYLDENPRPKYSDGKPAHTISVNQVLRKYDLSKGEFPICSLRKVAWKTGIREIFTIFQKPTNVISEMEDMKVTWWKDWDIGDGTIGKRYGYTVKHYDLVNNLLEDIKKDPFGRRKIMSLWQEDDLRGSEGLAPCAFLTMWNVRKTKNEYYLDMTLVQRSGDMLTASGAGQVNEVQYAALLMMIARHCNMKPGVFAHYVQNEQIYDRHIEVANAIKERFEENEENLVQPTMILNPIKTNFFDFDIDDFKLINYKPLEPNFKLDLGI